MNIAALVISALAVIFTLFSFWWLHWRRGRIIVGPPRSFAATSTGKDGLLIVQLPLVFYNDGAASQVVQNLRLSLVQDVNRSAILHFSSTLVDLANADTRKWARQFAIVGRNSYSSVFVFQQDPGNFIFAAGKCQATLEGKLNNQDSWEVLMTFDLQAPAGSVQALNSGKLIVYDNDPYRE